MCRSEAVDLSPLPSGRERAAATLVHLVAAGAVPEALDTVYGDPAASLDDIERDDPLARLVLNALDALGYAPVRTGEAAHLVTQLVQSPARPLPARVRNGLDALRTTLLAAMAKPEGAGAAQRDYERSFARLRRQHPSLFRPGDRPAFPVLRRAPEGDAAAGTIDARMNAARVRGACPIVVIEPLARDWQWLGALAGEPCVLAFADGIALHHAAPLAGVQEAVLDPAHAIWVMNRYPDHVATLDADDFAVVPTGDRDIDDATRVALAAAFTALVAARRDGADERAAAAWCYRAGRRVAYRRDLARLGDSRAANLAHREAMRDWFDDHKHAPPPGVSLGAPLDDRIDAVTATLRPARRRYLAALPRRLRVAHVLDTLVDEGHSPTRVVRTLLAGRDRTRFDPIVIAAETLARRPHEWPMPTTASDPARVIVSVGAGTTGRAVAARFAADGVETLVHDSTGSFERSATALARLLDAAKVDVAVFHGDAVLHVLAANAWNGPAVVCFDHGQLPLHRGFDAVIAATDEAARRHGARLAGLGTDVFVNEMVVDVTSGKDQRPLARSAIGAHDRDALLTTVSNHLEHRASPEFVAAVAEILRRFPNARYVPLGTVHDPVAFAARFAPFGVADRVQPLGSRDDVLRVLATCDLYLNEFPFGGGVATLEAMATGLPVVTMYDTRGETQGWAAAMYFGRDRAIASCEPRDYVELACSLISDEAMWNEWSAYARRRYAERSDVGAYVARFEQLLIDTVRNASRAAGRPPITARTNG